MRKVALIAFLFAILFTVSPALAQVKLTLSTNDLTIYAGENKNILITVHNDQNFQDNFVLSVWPPFFEDLSSNLEKYLISVPPNSNETVKLYFSIPDCGDEVKTLFNISVESTSSNVSDSQSIILTALRKFTVCISDFKLSKYGELGPSDDLTISTTITNPTIKISPAFSLETTIKKGDEIVTRFDDEITAIDKKSTKVISDTYTFEKYASPGDYVIGVVLKDSLDNPKSSKEYTISIKQINKTTIDRSSSIGFLSAITTVTARNDGNTPSPIVISTSIPSFVKNLFFAETPPTSTEETIGWTEYKWYFNSVNPGDSVTVKYEIKLFYVWIFCFLIIIVVIVAFKFVYGPVIVKRYRSMGAMTIGKEVTIALEVKNRGRHEMRGVEIRDFVPPLFSVSERFGTIKPLIIKKTDQGTRLFWKFDLLRPFDERVLTYSVKPIMDMTGTLKLPRATIKYLDRKKEIKTTVSKSILIKAK